MKELRNINDIANYYRNIQTLMIELFKIKCDCAPPIMGSMLNGRTICCNFRVSDGKKENCEAISYHSPQFMDTFAGRV